ncbi:hypothetical protein [Aeromonas caviae]|uniref:hypothetical protein n=1 Tax=Aeromonas caviae TaxID=648 RepID=UPI003989201E
MVDGKRGGARPGAGRPKGETTTMVRVPDGCLEQVRQLISAYRNHEPLPVSDTPVAEPVVLTDADKAWFIYGSMFARRTGGDRVHDTFFSLVSETEYPFIFLLHLLENLLNLPALDGYFPSEWSDIRQLRQFAKELYIHNGHLK